MIEDLEKARRISRMLTHEGWKDIRQDIDDRIALLTNSIISGKEVVADDFSVETIRSTQKGKKMEITLVNINKDSNRHELRFWKLFLKKIDDYEQAALEAGRKK